MHARFERQLSVYDPVVGHRFVPGLKARLEHEGGGYLVRTNELGFRSDREFSKEKDPGVFRVLVFGDSFTAGTGVSNRRRYSDLLEGMFPGVEVFNFGMPGTGPDEHYLIFQQFARELDYDLVVIAFWVENIHRSAARFRNVRDTDDQVFCVPKPYFVLDESGELQLRNVPVPRVRIDPMSLDRGERRYLPRHALVSKSRGVRSRLLSTVAAKTPTRAQRAIRDMIGIDPVPQYRSTRNRDWMVLRAILSAWIGEARSNVMVMPIPMPSHVEGRAPLRHYRARFRELADPPRVRIHDLMSDLERFSAAERRAFRFAHDFHPTPQYHKVIAESLAGALSTEIDAARMGTASVA